MICETNLKTRVSFLMGSIFRNNLRERRKQILLLSMLLFNMLLKKWSEQ